MKSVGFKEWAIVCEAMGRGEQSILLRKGGIAEGRAGFSFQYPEFFLFPTFFHEQVGKTRLAHAHLPRARPGEIEIKYFAKLELSAVVTSLETAVALEPFHILNREVVFERFQYDEGPGIHAALVRVYRLSRPWILSELSSYGGCRSWVTLPSSPAGTNLEPIATEEEHARRLRAFRTIVQHADAYPVTPPDR